MGPREQGALSREQWVGSGPGQLRGCGGGDMGMAPSCDPLHTQCHLHTQIHRAPEIGVLTRCLLSLFYFVFVVVCLRKNKLRVVVFFKLI